MNERVADESAHQQRTIELRVPVNASAARVYRGLTSSIEQGAIAGGRAMVEPFVGGKLSWADGRIGTITGAIEQLTPNRRLVLSLDPLPWIEGWGLGPQPRHTRLELSLADSPSGCELVLGQSVASAEQARCMEYEWRTFYLGPLQTYFERHTAASSADRALTVSPAAALSFSDAGSLRVLSGAGGQWFELPRRLALRLLELFSSPAPRSSALSRCDAAERVSISEAIDALLGTLVLVPVDQAVAAATRTRWEPHDRLFHDISTRFGNHGWHQLGRDDQLPAVKPPLSDRVTVLPDTEIPAISLPAALAARHSTREFDRRRIPLETLSGFLHCARNVRGVTATRWNHAWLPGEHISRVYPSGGALYSTELYLVVGKDGVEQVDSGVYHYCPDRHVLEQLCTESPAIAATLEAVSSESRLQPPPGPPPHLVPPVMLVISSRLGRVSYKYGGFAYALVLQEVGAMQQTFSLTATALGLGGCALGASPGAVGLLERQCAISPIDEPVVGFYMLGPY
jgi:SagB-type dehydrogenase family enzyme